MLRNRVGTWAVVVLTAGVVACGSSSPATSTDAGKDAHVVSVAGKDSGTDGKAPGNDGGGTDASGPTGPTAHFVLSSAMPNLMDVPFPTDLYLTTPSGLIVDPIPGAANVISSNTQFITHELGKQNGFSRIAQSLFWADDPSASDGIATIDPTTLPVSEAACVSDTSSVFLLDLSATGTAARIPCRSGFHDDRALGANGYRPNISVGPGRGVVLPEGHQYATVVTSRVKTKAGVALGATADFEGLSGPQTKSSLYATALSKVNAILGSALGSDKVVDMAVYTTSSQTKVLLQMRTALETATVPTLKWDQPSLGFVGATKFAAVAAGGTLPAGWTASLDDYLGTFSGPTLTDGTNDPNADLPVRAHDQIAAIGTAVFQAQNYLSPAQGYSVLDGATFSYDANGNVIQDTTTPTVPIWVTFFIPKVAPPTSAGYPVVIIQHGVGESRAIEPFNLANTFTKNGWIVAAIDSVTFGARASEPGLQVDKVNNFASGGGSYAGPDGLADQENPLNDLVGDLLNLGAMRDQFRQAEIDTSQLVLLLRSSPSLAPLQTGTSAPVIDGSHIAYVGNSLGAIQGAAAAAIEPYVSSWVLNVAGGGFILELADHSPSTAGDLSFAGLNFGAATDVLTESHPLINFIQSIFDPGDPISYAPYVVTTPATVAGKKLAAKNILQISVVYDQYVPNESNEALARALGINLAVPNVGTNSGVSTLAMVKDQTMIPDRLPLADQNPDDAGLIHDTPATGTTAVLVQTMPGIHGGNLQQGVSQHLFAIPYGQFTTSTPFVTLGSGPAASDPPFNITCSYLAQQAMAVRFLQDTFDGKVPNVSGFTAPVRDFDGDGFPDSTDSDVNNPNVH